MSEDIAVGERSGISVRAYRNGLWISGWYDSMVGIEGFLLPWETIDALRVKSKRRVEVNP